jgi:WD40 repeat protein
LLEFPIGGAEQQPISWSPDGNRIVGAAGFDARVWDAETGQELAELSSHFRDVITAYWSVDGTWMLTVDGGGTVRVWDADSFELLSSFDTTSNVASAAVSPNEDMIAITEFENIAVWDLISGQKVRQLVANEASLVHIVWTHDVLASIHSDHTVNVWDTSTWQLVESFNAPGFIYALALNPDGTQLVYGGANSLLEIVDVPSNLPR